MGENTHECPAPGCGEPLPFELFACRRHWYTIDATLRRDLWREWRRQTFESDYWEVRAKCLAALGVAPADISRQNAGVGLPDAA